MDSFRRTSRAVAQGVDKQELLALLDILCCDPNLRQDRGPISDGLQSGFPHCCIAFFVLIWSRAVLQGQDVDEAVTSGYRRLLNVARDTGRLEVGYVPCPACLLKILTDDVP